MSEQVRLADSAFRSAATISAPLAANARQTDRPMPLPAPVTTTRFPANGCLPRLASARLSSRGAGAPATGVPPQLGGGRSPVDVRGELGDPGGQLQGMGARDPVRRAGLAQPQPR